MWKLDGNMGNRDFRLVAVGTGSFNKETGQGIRFVLAEYDPNTKKVRTSQYPVGGPFGEDKIYDGNHEVLAYFDSPEEFDNYAGSMGIKMCPPTRVTGQVIG
jgi:hypothetical protein